MLNPDTQNFPLLQDQLQGGQASLDLPPAWVACLHLPAPERPSNTTQMFQLVPFLVHCSWVFTENIVACSFVICCTLRSS